MKLGKTATVCKNEDIENYVELKPDDYIVFGCGLYLENRGPATLKVDLPRKVEAHLLDEELE